MKYWITLKKTGKSLASIARDLNASYAVVHKSLQYSLNPNLPKGRKLSQKNFDEKYEITIADNFLGQMVEIKA